jgi:hypothetical protein
MKYNINMVMKSRIYTILVIIILLCCSCKKETSNDIIPEKIISSIEYNKKADIIPEKIVPDDNNEIVNNIVHEIIKSDYEMEEEELNNYLLNNKDIINLGYSYEFMEKYSNENILYYYYSNEWTDEVVSINYKNSISMALVKINENEYILIIEKDFIPFSEQVGLYTLAKFNENKFVFKTKDGWANIIVGNFYFDNNNIVLEMVCEKSFNFSGKNMAGRNYGGDKYILEKSNYWIIIE